MNTLLLSQATEAAKLLKQGEVVALPTETVYGLAGNATNAEIVKKIFTAKERPSFDPLIVHISNQIIASSSPFEELAKQNIIDSKILGWRNRNKIEAAMKHFWPGPLTMILPKGTAIPAEVTSNQDTVGLRCPKHPLFQEVLQHLPFPLAAPSANRFGRISPTNASHVQSELNGRIAGILDGGPCEVGVESTIIKITESSVTLLRPGKISATELQDFFQIPIHTAPSLMQTITESNVSPGMLDEHYAPRKPLYLIPFPFDDPRAESLLSSFPDFLKTGASFLAMSTLPSKWKASTAEHRILSDSNSLEEMARNLFSTMRELDENARVSVIFADSPADIREGLGASLFDRLKRASRNKPSPI